MFAWFSAFQFELQIPELPQSAAGHSFMFRGLNIYDLFLILEKKVLLPPSVNLVVWGTCLWQQHAKTEDKALSFCPFWSSRT